jgi:hypothetical protein
MTETILANAYVILGAVLLASFVAYLAWRNNYKGRSAVACAQFRLSVLEGLGGIYPPTERWKEDISESLISTLPAVKAACVVFHPYVSRFRRKAFEKAYAAYEQNCREPHPFALLLAHAVDPRGFPDNPQTAFSQQVSLLLSFADET